MYISFLINNRNVSLYAYGSDICFSYDRLPNDCQIAEIVLNYLQFYRIILYQRYFFKPPKKRGKEGL